jgi:hypothetical protein
MKQKMVDKITESCPRDREVDEWFNTRFEAMKDKNVEEETPIDPAPDCVLKDNGEMMNADEMMSDMLGDMKP